MDWAGQKNCWENFRSDLSEGYEVISIDFLGFGDSPKPKCEYSLENQIDSIEHVIKREGLNKDNTIIVGHSLGALIALGLVKKFGFQNITLIAIPIFLNKFAERKRLENIFFYFKLSLNRKYRIYCFFQLIYRFIPFIERKIGLPRNIYLNSLKLTWLSLYNTIDNLLFKIDVYDFLKDIYNKNVLFIHGDQDRTSKIEPAREFAKKTTQFSIYYFSKLWSYGA